MSRLGRVIEETPEEEAAEEVDGVLVAAQTRAIEPSRVGPLAVQAAAVAASGFVAGAATVAVVRHHRVKKAAKRRRRTARRELANVVASRSFLVDVHLLGGRDS
jgi:hypothetical protein